ncbi:MAG: bifunctional UDP-N-acetylglucosamine diphosphorylase/glucosamine-1-phosphate N-acetyltransferase GlmU, partial [Niameybacter sp.]
AYIRPNSSIGENVKIGDFVEIKNATIGEGTKVSHLTYIGDADVGAHVNFGCGTVVVNYDGQKKHRTTIKDNAFIGCNTNLVSPVIVEEGAYTAAGSTITNNVPQNSLGIARARQENKAEWVTKNRQN